MYFRHILAFCALITVAVTAAIPKPGEGESMRRKQDERKAAYERIGLTDQDTGVSIKKGAPEDVNLDDHSDAY